MFQRPWREACAGYSSAGYSSKEADVKLATTTRSIEPQNFACLSFVSLYTMFRKISYCFDTSPIVIQSLLRKRTESLTELLASNFSSDARGGLSLSDDPAARAFKSSDCTIRFRVVISLTLIRDICHSVVRRLGDKVLGRLRGGLFVQRRAQ